jgi:hypothetical protein
LKEKLMTYEMNRIDKGIIVDLKKYLDKKKRKKGNARHGFERGQHELLNQISKKLRKLEKQYGVK